MANVIKEIIGTLAESGDFVVRNSECVIVCVLAESGDFCGSDVYLFAGKGARVPPQVPSPTIEIFKTFVTNSEAEQLGGSGSETRQTT